MKPGQFVDPARLSADQFVRWCRACDTVLTKTGQSAFCPPCKKRHEGVLRRCRALASRSVVETSKRHLEQLHALAEDVRFDVGNLVVAYSHDKRNLAGKTHLVMGHLTELLHHIDEHFEDPRPPSERRRT